MYFVIIVEQNRTTLCSMSCVECVPVLNVPGLLCGSCGISTHSCNIMITSINGRTVGFLSLCWMEWDLAKQVRKSPPIQIWLQGWCQLCKDLVCEMEIFYPSYFSNSAVLFITKRDTNWFVEFEKSLVYIFSDLGLEIFTSRKIFKCHTKLVYPLPVLNSYLHILFKEFQERNWTESISMSWRWQRNSGFTCFSVQRWWVTVSNFPVRGDVSELKLEKQNPRHASTQQRI